MSEHRWFRLLPEWLVSCRADWPRPDIVAGLTTGAVIIPKGLADAGADARDAIPALRDAAARDEAFRMHGEEAIRRIEEACRADEAGEKAAEAAKGRP